MVIWCINILDCKSGVTISFNHKRDFNHKRGMNPSASISLSFKILVKTTCMLYQCTPLKSGTKSKIFSQIFPILWFFKIGNYFFLINKNLNLPWYINFSTLKIQNFLIKLRRLAFSADINTSKILSTKYI